MCFAPEQYAIRMWVKPANWAKLGLRSHRSSAPFRRKPKPVIRPESGAASLLPRARNLLYGGSRAEPARSPKSSEKSWYAENPGWRYRSCRMWLASSWDHRTDSIAALTMARPSGRCLRVSIPARMRFQACGRFEQATSQMKQLLFQRTWTLLLP